MKTKKIIISNKLNKLINNKLMVNINIKTKQTHEIMCSLSTCELFSLNTFSLAHIWFLTTVLQIRNGCRFRKLFYIVYAILYSVVNKLLKCLK